MANNINLQTIIDGEANYTIKYTAYIDSDITDVTLVDPALIGSTLSGQPTKVKLVELDYVTTNGITVQLKWDGATPKLLAEINGRGNIYSKKYGGLSDNATTPNGKVLISTLGGSTTPGQITLIFNWQKQFT